MPIHEYKCIKCEKTKEIKISIKKNVPVFIECECHYTMVKQWYPVGFCIIGYNAKNNYSKLEEGWSDLHTVR